MATYSNDSPEVEFLNSVAEYGFDANQNLVWELDGWTIARSSEEDKDGTKIEYRLGQEREV